MGVHQLASGREKRAFMRVPTALAGKMFFPPIDDEHDCIVTDISLGGATIQCGFMPALGTEIVLFLDGFGRFRGTVVRADGEEAGIHFEVSQEQRVRTAENIVLYIAGVRLRDTPSRQAERIAAPRNFARETGETVAFEIRDISLTGASFIAEVCPPLGETVAIGRASGRVIRHFDDGFAVEFVR
jgi:hypothetical protein